MAQQTHVAQFWEKASSLVTAMAKPKKYPIRSREMSLYIAFLDLTFILTASITLTQVMIQEIQQSARNRTALESH